MKILLITFVFLALCVGIGFAVCTMQFGKLTTPTPDPLLAILHWESDPQHEIRARLLAPVHEVAGLDHRRVAAANPQMDVIAKERPARVRVELLDGQYVEFLSIATFTWIRHGRVTAVHVTPMLQPADFDTTVEMLHGLLVSWDVEPDPEMLRTIQSWGPSLPGRESGMDVPVLQTGMKLRDGSRLGVRWTPAYESGWVLALSVNIPVEQYETLSLTGDIAEE